MTSLNATPRTTVTPEDRRPVRTRRRAVRPVGVLVALLAVAALTPVTHAWYLPFLAGLILGGWRLRAGAAVAGAGGWALVLLWRWWSGEPVGDAAAVTAALAGLPALPWLIVAVTLLIALLQGLCGAWLSSSVVTLIRGRRGAVAPTHPAFVLPQETSPENGEKSSHRYS